MAINKRLPHGNMIRELHQLLLTTSLGILRCSIIQPRMSVYSGLAVIFMLFGACLAAVENENVTVLNITLASDTLKNMRYEQFYKVAALMCCCNVLVCMKLSC